MRPEIVATCSDTGGARRAAATAIAAAPKPPTGSTIRATAGRRPAATARPPTKSAIVVASASSAGPPPKSTAAEAAARAWQARRTPGPQRSGRARIASIRAVPSAAVTSPRITSTASASSSVSRWMSNSPGSTRTSTVRRCSGLPNDAKIDVGVEKNRASIPSRALTRASASSRRWAGVPNRWSAPASPKVNWSAWSCSATRGSSSMGRPS